MYIQDDLEDGGIVEPFEPQPQQKGLSPGDILHVNEQEGQLLNAYLKDTFVRKVASVSPTNVQPCTLFLLLI